MGPGKGFVNTPPEHLGNGDYNKSNAMLEGEGAYLTKFPSRSRLQNNHASYFS